MSRKQPIGLYQAQLGAEKLQVSYQDWEFAPTQVRGGWSVEAKCQVDGMERTFIGNPDEIETEIEVAINGTRTAS